SRESNDLSRAERSLRFRCDPGVRCGERLCLSDLRFSAFTWGDHFCLSLRTLLPTFSPCCHAGPVRRPKILVLLFSASPRLRGRFCLPDHVAMSAITAMSAISGFSSAPPPVSPPDTPSSYVSSTQSHRTSSHHACAAETSGSRIQIQTARSATAPAQLPVCPRHPDTAPAAPPLQSPADALPSQTKKLRLIHSPARAPAHAALSRQSLNAHRSMLSPVSPASQNSNLGPVLERPL